MSRYYIYALAMCISMQVLGSCGRNVADDSGHVSVSDKQDVHEFVDLGLSVKWATCNVGASSPEEFGDYFAWGETVPKTTYCWSTYKWCKGNHDAAYENWGSHWRMPTKAEMEELRSNCTWTWVPDYEGSGVSGRIIIGPNGNKIFLPAAGGRWGSNLYAEGAGGFYWSGSCNEHDELDAYYLLFDSGSVNCYSYGGRCNGRSVRAVCP